MQTLILLCNQPILATLFLSSGLPSMLLASVSILYNSKTVHRNIRSITHTWYSPRAISHSPTSFHAHDKISVNLRAWYFFRSWVFFVLVNAHKTAKILTFDCGQVGGMDTYKNTYYSKIQPQAF